MGRAGAGGGGKSSSGYDPDALPIGVVEIPSSFSEESSTGIVDSIAGAGVGMTSSSKSSVESAVGDPVGDGVGVADGQAVG